MRKLWLIFAQSVTISLAFLFVIQQFKPSLLQSPAKAIVVNQVNAKSSPQSSASSYSRAAAKAMPSVVNIFTSKKKSSATHPFMDDPLFRKFFNDQTEDQPQQHENSLGSGVIVNADGLILTNQHVVESADEINVALADGRTIEARVVGGDPDTDLAVIKIDMKYLPAITFGHSEQVNVGDIALAIGNPFGVGQTVTQGIVSALGRNHLGINTFENFIQTDASINPGNSGGALVDIEGNLIGINSAIYSRNGGSMGIGFAIPVSLAQQIMEQIIRQGSVTRGWVGIEAQDITPELAESFKLKEKRGALIAGVIRGAPGEKAGIHPGDILLQIDDHIIMDSGAMLNIIAALKPDHSAKLKIIRDDQILTLNVKIGKRPKPEKEED